ncbi:MAG: hypothetical protein UU93_C0003G0013 [Candidatus Amesbacteria bacterium GW2011_GWA2_42_12]|uniref:Uncharacterized protein n=1 Tax=Candidatus Amesbacteria bacterium GW2011_GWA2_42_12 TaxID=1618356 RepID=A0A0G0Y8H2_9BACT|nr:MAG: hypothetical protein UU93_C0003G0013 [Candidatus Amesbacteria bacterium GW2011_GWA2_42_12]
MGNYNKKVKMGHRPAPRPQVDHNGQNIGLFIASGMAQNWKGRQRRSPKNKPWWMFWK